MDGGKITTHREGLMAVMSITQASVPGLTVSAHMTAEELNELIHDLQMINYQISWLTSDFMYVGYMSDTNHIALLPRQLSGRPHDSELRALKALCGRHDEWYKAHPGYGAPSEYYLCKRCRQIYLARYAHEGAKTP